MHFLGLGLHVLIALFFAVHVVRTGREVYWLFILFMFPLLGSIVYFVAVYLPDSRIERGVRRVATAAVRSLDPGRELREARAAFELTPTAQNQMRLADALLAAGEPAEATAQYEACLQGPFARDPEVRFGAARAYLQNGAAAQALSLIEPLQAEQRDFKPEAVALLLAQSYAELGRHSDAQRIYRDAVDRFGSIEVRVAYALWALRAGEPQTAREQQQQIEAAAKHWPRHTRELNAPLLKQLDAVFAAAGQ
jgi:hypothetical protein